MERFNGRCSWRQIEGNTGESFENRRRDYYGGSDAPAICGVSKYKTSLRALAQKAGDIPEDSVSKKKAKIFANGHIKELEVATTGVEFMKIDSGFDIILHPCDKLEWLNDEWPHARGHLDFVVEVIKGRIIENPDFYVGGPEPNWKIIPDDENHMYVADSKTVQGDYGKAWNERDASGVSIGGLSNGVCPLPYWVQLHFYMTLCNIDGGLIFGSIGNNSVDDYATVFVPFDAEAGQTIMDTCERRFTDALNGKFPKLGECGDKDMAARDIAALYPVNPAKSVQRLKGRKWTKHFREVADIEKQIEDLKESIAEESAKVASIKKEIDALREKRRTMLLEPIESVKDAKGCYFTDEYGETTVIEYRSKPVWNCESKEAYRDAIRQLDPEKAAELEAAYTTRDISVSRSTTVKTNLKAGDPNEDPA